MDNLPAELQTEPLPQRTRIVDANGNVIASLYDENRINVPLSQISRTMVKAIVAIEDYRFYQHGALDLKGTLRALVTNQANSGVVQGGSSITQQMVKLTLLSQAKTKAEQQGGDRRHLRAQDPRAALRDRASSRTTPRTGSSSATSTSPTSATAPTASRRPPGTTSTSNAKDLNLRAVGDAGRPGEEPHRLRPDRTTPTARSSARNVVLDRMAAAQRHLRSDRPSRPRSRARARTSCRPSNGCVFSRAPFFCDYVLNYLEKDPRARQDRGRTRKKLLYSGGLTIHTTIDLRVQAGRRRLGRRHVYPTDQAIGAPGDGRAAHRRRQGASPSRGRWAATRAQGETYLNYVGARRSTATPTASRPGSTFKAVRARRGDRAGHPAHRRPFNSPSR